MKNYEICSSSEEQKIKNFKKVLSTTFHMKKIQSHEDYNSTTSFWGKRYSIIKNYGRSMEKVESNTVITFIFWNTIKLITSMFLTVVKNILVCFNITFVWNVNVYLILCRYSFKIYKATIFVFFVKIICLLTDLCMSFAINECFISI